MSIRTDLTVNWKSSPRVITIADTSDEITIQDLLDTCRFFEDSFIGINYPHLIEAAGKEFLGGVTYVGITAILQNAVIAFEGRDGPDWVLCSIVGGNLVAVDENGDQIDPRKPTAYVTIDRTSSSSATLQELTTIQHSSFNNGVTIDVVNGSNGVLFPIGTAERPCKNVIDAKTIAEARGFSKFYILGNIVFGAGHNIDNYIIVGQSPMKSLVVLETAASVDGTEFKDVTVTGILDGDTKLTDCLIGPLLYVSGFIYNCVFGDATIVLGGSSNCHFFNCGSGVVSLDDCPIIDFGGSGRGLGLRRYDGEIKLINKTGPEIAVLDINSGHVIIDESVTNGEIIIRGVCEVTDNSTGDANVIQQAALDIEEIADAVWDEQISDHQTDGSIGKMLSMTNEVECGKWEIINNQMIFYKSDNETELMRFNLYDKSGVPSMKDVYKRVRVG